MKIILLCIGLNIMAIHDAVATDFYFYYDDAGNREERTGTQRLKIGVEQHQLEESSILFNARVAPNPTNDFINVTLENYDGESMIQYELVDLTGRSVILGDASSANISIDIYNVAVGNYWLNILGGGMISRLFR